MKLSTQSIELNEIIDNPPQSFSGVADGYDALILADYCRALSATGKPGLLHIARDAGKREELETLLAFFAPDITVLSLPAWDCLPYDRVGPGQTVMSQRMSTLARLANLKENNTPYIVLTSINAVLQKFPARDIISKQSFSARVGDSVDIDDLFLFLSENGFIKSSLVMEQGDFAMRGSIVDLYPPGEDQPFRLDFFGETLETIRVFEPESQRSLDNREEINLYQASEIRLDEETVTRFRQGYIKQFGPATSRDQLYEAISDKRRHQGMEHWLPLFHENLESIFNHCEDMKVTMDHLAQNAADVRFEQINDYYEARCQALEMALKNETPALYPLPPEYLYMSQDDWEGAKKSLSPITITPFETDNSSQTAESMSFGAREGRNFTADRNKENINIFNVLSDYVNSLIKDNKKVLITSWSAGASERLSNMLADHNLKQLTQVNSWNSFAKLPEGEAGIGVLPLETGFEANNIVVITEQDVFGDRLVKRKAAKKAANFITEASTLSKGDLVVHVDHGVARFEGLETIIVSSSPHDCLKLVYYGDDRLYLPVENIDLLSRYGPDDVGAQLDRLGTANWQTRKARLKNKLRDIADELIKIAAARELREGRVFEVDNKLYETFCARFPYNETDDQLESIEAVIEDFASGRPMDRLICGDVGFGKTEVALRAAFIVAMSGAQTAIIAPTTLLARQHSKTFRERFEGLPIEIREMSRLVGQKEITTVKQELKDGKIDIVIGTHTLLSKEVELQNPGLVIIDEEQRFGVKHKEQLKKLKSEIHVLTLSATPIPRTLQLALTGVRDLSLIATPPVDRLAVRTYVTPFDPVIVREALLREKYRAGQSFFICPHITNLDEITEFLTENVPEVNFITAHGQMAGKELESRMTAFYDGQYDVLISTSIIESGLDIPSANTLIIHNAHLFGLAQLYQMRGRVGRSKLRAYAYITYDDLKPLTGPAEKRLKVLQSLDSLGAGFTLASHDLDLRGAGNLLGEEQSGHIKEVGYELYQSMLEEAVALQKGVAHEESWSPQINIDTPVLLPETYIEDFELRMAMYRRLSNLLEPEQVDGFAIELIDRFGSLPDETENLLQVVIVKTLCRKAGIEKIDVGNKGVIMTFRNNEFANPAGLVDYLSQHASHAKLRPDHTIVFRMNWKPNDERLGPTRKIIEQLVDLVSADTVA